MMLLTFFLNSAPANKRTTNLAHKTITDSSNFILDSLKKQPKAPKKQF